MSRPLAFLPLLNIVDSPRPPVLLIITFVFLKKKKLSLFCPFLLFVKLVRIAEIIIGENSVVSDFRRALEEIALLKFSPVRFESCGSKATRNLSVSCAGSISSRSSTTGSAAAGNGWRTTTAAGGSRTTSSSSSRAARTRPRRSRRAAGTLPAITQQVSVFPPSPLHCLPYKFWPYGQLEIKSWVPPNSPAKSRFSVSLFETAAGYISKGSRNVVAFTLYDQDFYASN